MHQIEFPGDPRHPDHERFLLELGRATYAATRLAGVAFDVLRILGGKTSAELYDDTLGALKNKLKDLDCSKPGLPGLSDFRVHLESALTTRNDLFHALPVKDGFHRRVSKDLYYIRNFYSMEDLSKALAIFQVTFGAGHHVLYHDGGSAVKAWVAAGQRSAK